MPPWNVTWGAFPDTLPDSSMRIRAEEPADVATVREINAGAFETSAEADLVDLLRAQASPVVSLVADLDGRVAGHILFSPVTLDGQAHPLIMGLAPMAVASGNQRQGVGSALVREGLERCRQLGATAVVVLGHHDYYPRFGFVPASRYGVRCEYDVPDDVFMALELRAGALDGKPGTIRYHAAFAEL